MSARRDYRSYRLVPVPCQMWGKGKYGCCAFAAAAGDNPAGTFFNVWGARSFKLWAAFMRIADEAYGRLLRKAGLGVSGTARAVGDFDGLLMDVRAA